MFEKINNHCKIWLNGNRSRLAKGVSALENIIYEITALRMKTLCKFENLR